MKRYILEAAKRPIIRNILIMSTGTAAAQLVSLLFQPIITRMYGPEAYGLMGIFMAIVGIVAPIAALTYPIAIVLPKNDSDAKGLIRLSMYVATGISVIVGLGLLLFHSVIISVFHLEDVASFLFLIPLVILFSGFLQVTEQWLIRTKQFGITAKVMFFQTLLLNGSKLGIGFFYPAAAVLIIISALGNGVKALMMLVYAKKSTRKDTKLEDIKNDKISVKELAKRYKDFPIFRSPEVFLDAISQSLPILMLTGLFGPASAGFYTLSKTVLKAPFQLIGKSIGDVFYPHISEAAKNNKNLTKIIRKATIALAMLGVIPFGIIIIFGPDIFSLVFGEEWIIAGQYARWMSVGIFFEFVNKPCVKALPVLSAQAFQLQFTIAMLIVRLSALTFSYYLFGSDLAAIAFFGISGAILNLLFIIITLHKSKKYDYLNGH